MEAVRQTELNCYALTLSILTNRSTEESLQFFGIMPPQKHSRRKRTTLPVEDIRKLVEQGLCKTEIRQELGISREILDHALEEAGIYDIDWRKRGFAYKSRLRREKNANL